MLFTASQAVLYINKVRPRMQYMCCCILGLKQTLWFFKSYLTCITRYLLVLQNICGLVIRSTYSPFASVSSV